MKKYVSLFCVILIAVSLLVLRKTDSRESGSWGMENSTIKKYVVVIDAGHGGFDPGKVGISGELEKEINLQIAQKLKVFLEMNDCQVIMTRDTDDGLYSAGDSNKKSADMRKRVQIIADTKPDIAISVHQNSFTQESSKGAQVFYHA